MPELPLNSPPPVTATRMYAVVVGVGVVCSLAIVSVHELTQPIIHNKMTVLTNRAILDVLPGACQSVALHWTADGTLEECSPSMTEMGSVFAGYDRDGQLVGFAVETHGMGYQDVVRVLYGYSRERQAIIGLRVLRSSETPGLGDRIETDADFLQNFTRLDVSLNPQGDALAHPLEFVKPGQKRAAWQIDGITGATISSRAIAAMLRDSTTEWIPRLNTYQADFPAPLQKELSSE